MSNSNVFTYFSHRLEEIQILYQAESSMHLQTVFDQACTVWHDLEGVLNKNIALKTQLKTLKVYLKLYMNVLRPGKTASWLKQILSTKVPGNEYLQMATHQVSTVL